MRDEILKAIENGMGVNLGQIRSNSRKRKLVFARFVYAHHRYEEVQDVEKIAEEINRDRNTVDYYLEKYNDDYRCSKIFRAWADAVIDQLKKSQQ